jgi:hypothetical protein
MGKWSFSIAMLVYQRVSVIAYVLEHVSLRQVET